MGIWDGDENLSWQGEIPSPIRRDCDMKPIHEPLIQIGLKKYICSLNIPIGVLAQTSGKYNF